MTIKLNYKSQMILHTIIKYKQKVSVPAQSYGLVPITYTPIVRQNQSTQLYLFDKLAYSKFIENLPYKKGECVILRTAEYPFKKSDVWKIEDIQELYWDCKDNKPGMVPKPIIIVNEEKTQRMYVAAAGVIACPKELAF